MFELHITSSKDIKNLNIEFMDGTTVNSKQDKQLKKELKNDKKENIPNNLLKKSDISDIKIEDIITSSSKKSFDIVESTDVNNRPIKVAPELEGLDI